MRIPCLLLVPLLAGCAGTAPKSAPKSEYATAPPAKSTERVLPEVRYYLIADA